MDGSAGASAVSGLSGRYSATGIKVSWPGCRRDAWLAHVRRRALLRVGSRRLRMLSLSRHGRDMSLTRRSRVFRSWIRDDSTVATIVADVVHRSVIDGCVVNVVNFIDVHVVHGTVVEKVSVIPTPAFVTLPEIAEAVIDPAVEAYVRTPVAVIENKSVAAPNPNRLESTGNRFPAPSPMCPAPSSNR